MKNHYSFFGLASFCSQRFSAGVSLRVLFALVLCLTLSMCKQPEILKEVDNRPTATKERRDQLTKEFGKALARVLYEEQGVRQLIKTEALKQFDRDYDVLYHMVKDQPIRDGKTFRQLLSQAMRTTSSSDVPAAREKPLLEEIERELPLLTIMVPELPENSFSAEIWDAATQIPLVGLRVWNKEGVPMLAGNGEESFFPFGVMPAFPVVVVKENERVTTTQQPDELTFKAPNTDFYYRFTDANFDNPKKPGKNSGARVAFGIDQKLIDARDIMNPVDGWHRDHIYYDLTPSNDKGPFKLTFKEKITSFRFDDNYAKEAFNKIADQGGDPRPAPISTNNSTVPTTAAWTDGSFEFMVNALVNSKATGRPAIAPKFPVKGSELFDVKYQLTFWRTCKWYQGCFGKDFYVYTPTNFTSKIFYPPGNVELINWDLDRFAPTMLITIKEIDLSQTVTTKETVSTEFAANFGIEGSTLKKIGLKFGASLKQSLGSERTIVTSLESDDMGEAFIEFGDKVILDEGRLQGSILNGLPYHLTREYPAGWVWFSMEPVKVE